MTPDATFRERLSSRLMSHGMYLAEFDDDGGTFQLEYESHHAEQGTIPHREVGRVINVIRDLHGDGWTGTRIEAVVTDFDGVIRGEWYVERGWLAALDSGDLSEVEFSRRVIETLES